MEFRLDEAIPILERTPAVIDAMLRGVPEEWTRRNEGKGSWSAYDIVGHLIHGEKTDWIPRAKIILEQGEERPFEPFDRFAQLRDSVGKSLENLLDEFARRRAENLEALRTLKIEPSDYSRTGVHPEFGRVTLSELLSTWAVHDLGHIRQIARVMAKQYKDQVGPWRAYIPVLGEGGVS